MLLLLLMLLMLVLAATVREGEDLIRQDVCVAVAVAQLGAGKEL